MKSVFLVAIAPVALAGALSLSAISANAVTVSCPGTSATTDREFTLDTTPAATCFDYGTGNLTGNPLNDLFLNGAGSGLDLLLVDKTDDGTSGSNPNAISLTAADDSSGSWSFDSGFDLSGFTRLFLGLKSGNGKLDPDWVVFELALGTSGGDWTISSQGLSHMNLYGQASVASPPTSVVPLPASALLLLSGLLGLGLFGWRRRAATA